tara:strand:+ start:649 stop:1293 length:645 start_codon:yes stop_codon:yes gene_type:complete
MQFELVRKQIFFFRTKIMSRGDCKDIDVDALTECADDLVLHDVKGLNICNKIIKYMWSISKKTSVDYIYLAMVDIIRMEKTSNGRISSQKERDKLRSLMFYILSQLDEFCEIDNSLYYNNKLILYNDISYGIYSTSITEEAMMTLTNPVCLWIQVKNIYGVCLIREVHCPFIKINAKRIFHVSPMDESIKFNGTLMNELLDNAARVKRQRLLCC